MVGTESLRFCFSGNVFISSSLLKDGFSGFIILSWPCFSFTIVKISRFSLPALSFLLRNLLPGDLGFPVHCFLSVPALSLLSVTVSTVDSLKCDCWSLALRASLCYYFPIGILIFLKLQFPGLHVPDAVPRFPEFAFLTLRLFPPGLHFQRVRFGSCVSFVVLINATCGILLGWFLSSSISAF